RAELLSRRSQPGHRHDAHDRLPHPSGRAACSARHTRPLRCRRARADGAAGRTIRRRAATASRTGDALEPVRNPPVMHDDLLRVAKDIAALVAPRAAETEAGRRLPPDLADAMAAAGLFKVCVPAAYGGGEAAPAALVEAIEIVSAADGSAGWCFMIGATS